MSFLRINNPSRYVHNIHSLLPTPPSTTIQNIPKPVRCISDNHSRDHNHQTGNKVIANTTPRPRVWSHERHSLIGLIYFTISWPKFLPYWLLIVAPVINVRHLGTGYFFSSVCCASGLGRNTNSCSRTQTLQVRLLLPRPMTCRVENKPPTTQCVFQPQCLRVFIMASELQILYDILYCIYSFPIDLSREGHAFFPKVRTVFNYKILIGVTIVKPSDYDNDYLQQTIWGIVYIEKDIDFRNYLMLNDLVTSQSM